MGSESQVGERIGIRIPKELRKELEKEMKQLGITRISTYVRMILEKRKSRTKAYKNDTKNEPILTRKTALEFKDTYMDFIKKIESLSKEKNPDGSPKLNETVIKNMINQLNERTANLIKLWAEFLNNDH